MQDFDQIDGRGACTCGGPAVDLWQGRCTRYGEHRDSSVRDAEHLGSGYSANHVRDGRMQQLRSSNSYTRAGRSDQAESGARPTGGPCPLMRGYIRCDARDVLRRQLLRTLRAWQCGSPCDCILLGRSRPNTDDQRMGDRDPGHPDSGAGDGGWHQAERKAMIFRRRLGLLLTGWLTGWLTFVGTPDSVSTAVAADPAPRATLTELIVRFDRRVETRSVREIVDAVNTGRDALLSSRLQGPSAARRLLRREPTEYERNIIANANLNSVRIFRLHERRLMS